MQSTLKRKKILLFTKDELKSYQSTKAYQICRKRILKKFANYKNYQKVGDHGRRPWTKPQHIVFVI